LTDWDRLSAYLEGVIDGFRGPIEARAFDEGQSNPTYKLTTPSGKYVLQKQPPGPLLKGAHAVDREFRVQRALWDTDVPVARVLHLCEDETVLGTMFYVMEFAAGRIFWDPALPELSPEDRGQVYDEMNRVLAAIHNTDLSAMGLSDFGRPGDYFARQLKLWRGQ
jgi:aminoglycoside phosphotransferase (APT) family kinase protein